MNPGPPDFGEFQIALARDLLNLGLTISPRDRSALEIQTPFLFTFSAQGTSVAFTPPANGFIVGMGSSGGIAVTTNIGLTWNSLAGGFSGPRADVIYMQPQGQTSGLRVPIVGGGKYYVTASGGCACTILCVFP